MTDQQLTDLREWAAGVCGYVHDHGNWYFKCPLPWRPDQNIAQAFEVLTATLEQRPGAFRLDNTIGWNVIIERNSGDGYEAYEGRHASAATAILLACRKALNQEQHA